MKSVKIGGINYKIIERDMISFGSLIGHIDYIKQEITLEQSLQSDKKHQTLLHEIVHGICNEVGISIMQNNEDAVQAFAQALCDIVDIRFCTEK